MVAGRSRSAGGRWGGLLGLALVSCAPLVSAAEGRAGSVVNVAHRGGIVDGVPENTLSAFRRAIALGVDAIELDLRGTRDGHVVVLHDETLDRTTSGTGPVTDHDLAALKTLDAGGGERIPTYGEVLDLVSGTGVQLLLDIKVSPALDRPRVVRETEAHRAVLNVIVGVRTLEDLREFRALDPNLRVLAFVPDVDAIASFVAAGADIVRVWPRWIRADPALVGRVQGMGRAVWTTADDAPRQELEALVASGVNGVLTDRPGLLAEVLAGAEGGAGATTPPAAEGREQSF